jgi:hypothetical protein
MAKKLFKRDDYSYSKKRFLQLCEYVSASPLLEDDDEDMNNANQETQDDQMNGNMPMDNQMGSDMNQQMNDGNGDNNGMNMDNMNNSQNNTQIDNTMDMPMDNQMDIPMDDQIGDISSSDDEVIDVDDLTNAQEKVNDKVNHVGRNLEDVDDKISQLMSYIDKMESMINKNNEDIQAFKAEFERRNPTDVEKMNLRAANSYPFNVSPTEYWDEKQKEGRYSIEDDNNGVGQKKYEITNSDINDYNDSSIAKSFHIDDDLRQSIEKIFDIK